MKKITLINGANLNLLGTREPEIYGTQTFESFFEQLQQQYSTQATLIYQQSNHEGDIVDYIQDCIHTQQEGIIINAGAYTHYSYAISDALRAFKGKIIEVHLSNIYARESFRQHSVIAPVAQGCIVGLGLEGYRLAIEYFLGT